MEDWESWAIGRAHRLVELRRNALAGGEFIAWLVDHLESSRISSLGKLLGWFYADQAFMLGNDRILQKTYALKAIRYDISWIKNRGLITRLIKSCYETHR